MRGWAVLAFCMKSKQSAVPDFRWRVSLEQGPNEVTPVAERRLRIHGDDEEGVFEAKLLTFAVLDMTID